MKGNLGRGLLCVAVLLSAGCGNGGDHRAAATATAVATGTPPPTATATMPPSATPSPPPPATATVAASATATASASATATTTATVTAPPTPTETGSLVFGQPGAIAAPAGRGSFRFGAATAATQIEDQNPTTDWYLWTAPAPDGLGHDTFVGDAVQGYSRAIDDVELLRNLHLDSYRFSIEWARVEPRRDVIDESALAHYDAAIDALVAAGIRPNVTVHHFASPVWVDDPRHLDCPGGPTDANLCGWADPVGAEQIIAELAAHARLLAQRYGDRVDDWATFNEPVNYLLASYGIGQFPPGRTLLIADFGAVITVVRNVLRAHVAMYDAIKEADQIDADGDGVAANVGLTLNVAEWLPSHANAPSTRPEDIAAAERIRYVYHHVVPDSLLFGGFDADLDQVREESHPDWTGKLDWLGVQYYSRQGVSAEPPLIPVLNLMVCIGDLDFGTCVPPPDPTHWVPAMRYEYYEPGIYNVLTDFARRWPSLPLTVTESGLATENGTRRAEHVVRSLEQIHRALDEGVDVRGYYHWSLMDNFEWAQGFVPRFGLHRVDFATYARTPTEGATVLGEIAAARRIPAAMRARYGGLGPMSPEP
ncbi:family 1 glycosylhydrolase [bacterium]|nr:family 1 glycosylhydrolase [bacterium]